VLTAVLDGYGTRSFSACPGWSRMALAGTSSSLASLWIIPRLAADPAFEQAMEGLKRRPAASTAPTTLLRGAPGSATLSVALGAGPVAPMLRAMVDPDDAYEIPLPEPDAAEQARWTPQQIQAHQLANAGALRRGKDRKELRKEWDRLFASLNADQAACSWHGWTPAPPLSAAEKESAKRGESSGLYGGRGEPGMTPSLAAAVPVKEGRSKEAEAALARIFQMAFKGASQTRAEAAGYTLHRIRTTQAFTPAWALVKDMVVVGSDDRAVASVAEGLLGRASTLADAPTQAWGAAQLDGEHLAKDLEYLLASYLSTQRRSSARWLPVADTPRTADDAAAEVAETFGPFLGLLKRQGKVPMTLAWTAAGFEVRPK
jgi:hypothetical protein